VEKEARSAPQEKAPQDSCQIVRSPLSKTTYLLAVMPCQLSDKIYANMTTCTASKQLEVLDLGLSRSFESHAMTT
jgi:hypothetical protein